jgi:hypothetical protein
LPVEFPNADSVLVLLISFLSQHCPVHFVALGDEQKGSNALPTSPG